MAKALITEQYLTDIADAIRFKLDTDTKYLPEDMASAIRDMHPVMHLQSKTVSSSGMVTPDNGYDGLSSVIVDVVNGEGFVSLIKAIGRLEYAGNIYGSGIIAAANLVLLGDFSQGGAASDNVLSDSVLNYTAVILQGIYRGNRTSEYNTSMIYLPDLNVSRWAGMQDRNSNYTCNVTFTDETHCSLSGNRQVIIYGLP